MSDKNTETEEKKEVKNEEPKKKEMSEEDFELAFKEYIKNTRKFIGLFAKKWQKKKEL